MRRARGGHLEPLRGRTRRRPPKTHPEDARKTAGRRLESLQEARLEGRAERRSETPLGRTLGER